MRIDIRAGLRLGRTGWQAVEGAGLGFVHGDQGTARWQHLGQFVEHRLLQDHAAPLHISVAIRVGGVEIATLAANAHRVQSGQEMRTNALHPAACVAVSNAAGDVEQARGVECLSRRDAARFHGLGHFLLAGIHHAFARQGLGQGNATAHTLAHG